MTDIKGEIKTTSTKLWKDKFIRIGTYLLIFLITGLVAFEIIYKSYYKGQLLGADIGLFTTTIKDFFQIIFFCVVITVTILSYLQAKKSLFTPIKTETFKMQIKAFEEILLFFQNKRETDFTSQFDFDNLLGINAQLLIIDYIETFFKNEVEIDPEKVKELRNNSAGAVVTQNYASKHFVKPDYYEKQEKKEKEEITNPALILREWENYEYGKIEFTNKFNEEIEKLKNLSASPLIPQPLKDKINFFNKKIHDNLFLIGKVLTAVAKELPTTFPNSKSLNNLNQSGMWNKYNNDMEKVEEDAQQILAYIRQYLKIDELIK
jgi:hypothetical protein